MCIYSLEEIITLPKFISFVFKKWSLGLFEVVTQTKRRRRKKISSDIGSVPDTKINYSYYTRTFCSTVKLL